MPDPLFSVHFSRDDYPSPAVEDREQDEELGAIVVAAVEAEGDGWLVSYGHLREPHLLRDQP